MYKFKNYPFHEFERDLLSREIITSRAAIVNDVLDDAAQKLGVILLETAYVNESNSRISRPALDHALAFIPNFNEYANIYGYQATRLSLLLHPVDRKIELNAQDAFACWKIVNRVWSLFSSFSYSYLEDESSKHDLIARKGSDGSFRKRIEFVAQPNAVSNISNISNIYIRSNEDPVIQLRQKAAEAIARGKAHTYVARCLHFVKNHFECLDSENIEDILSIFSPVIPLISSEIKEGRARKLAEK